MLLLRSIHRPVYDSRAHDDGHNTDDDDRKKTDELDGAIQPHDEDDEQRDGEQSVEDGGDVVRLGSLGGGNGAHDVLPKFEVGDEVVR